MSKQYVMYTAIAILGGVFGFFGGMQFQKAQTPQFGAFRNGSGSGLQGNGVAQGNRMMGGDNNRMGFRPLNGEIISADDTSLTIKMQDGSSKIVLLTDATEINTAATASASDLKIGETVLVIGRTNTDGSVEAQNIQLNPIMRMNRDQQRPDDAASQ